MNTVRSLSLVTTTRVLLCAGAAVAMASRSAALSALMALTVAAYLAAEYARFRRRRKRAQGIRRAAVELAASRNPADRFASTRALAHDAGLPWIEPDGTITRPGVTR